MTTSHLFFGWDVVSLTTDKAVVVATLVIRPSSLFLSVENGLFYKQQPPNE
jgi:hypothetical protein